MKPGSRTALATLIAVHAALAFHSLQQKSVTLDEYAHLPAGVTYWQQGTFGLYHQNPPLLKLLAALPVLASGAEVDYEGAWRAASPPDPPHRWTFGDDFQAANAGSAADGVPRYHVLFQRGRAVVVAISCLGAWLIYRFGREVYGEGGALVAAATWCLAPNVLAHARLVTTDLAAAVAFIGATYALWCWYARGGVARLVLGGIALGLAQLTKFTGLLLYPLGALLLVVWHLRAPKPGRSGATVAGGWLATVGISVLVVNVGYLGEGTFTRLGDFPFLSRTLTVAKASERPPDGARRQATRRAQRANRFAATPLAGLPVPLPYHYVAGFDEQKWESETETRDGRVVKGYPVYLDGEHRRGGWWYYYLACLVYKLPLATLAWLLLATLAALSGRPRVRAAGDGTFAIAGLFVGVAMTAATDIDIGFRYVLPVIPFLCLWIGRLGAPGLRLRRAVALGVVALGLLSVARIHPHYLSHFNAFAGGPEGGRHHLLDSNLDWGQDLVALRRFMDERALHRVWLAYFGNEDPANLGIDFRLPPGPQPGWNAVSVNYVMGLPFSHLRDGKGHRVRLDRPAFVDYQRFEPDERAGYSIDLYYLSAEDLARAGLRASKTIDH